MNWSSLRSSLGFFHYLRQSRFTEALAQLPPGSWPQTAWEQVACYRLGLYATVAQCKWDGKHLQGGVAMAVSLASCGQTKNATEIVQRLVARHGSGRYQLELADALAPLLPELALSLLDKKQAPLTLRVALLLRTGAQDEAAHMLQRALDSQDQYNPELLLFATNALGGNPAKQLSRINQYIQAFDLPYLALDDESRPPSPINLKATAPLPTVLGPRVSILMTAYNAADRIESAIKGLLAQTWNNLEVVVVDDGSHDATQIVARKLAAKDRRVHYLRMPQNAGTYIAKTAGLRLAKGEYITCHDSDDWSHPMRIEKQMQPLLDNPSLVATTSKWVRMEDNGRFYTRQIHPLTRLNPASPLFRRSLVEKNAGLWDAVRTGADSEFDARLCLNFGRKSIKRLRQPLAFGSHRPDSLMTASETGYNTAGISLTRLAYWEAWTLWHIQSLHSGNKPIMPPPPNDRPFTQPSATEITKADITRCLDRSSKLEPDEMVPDRMSS